MTDKPNRAPNKERTPMKFYIDGTIDSISISTDRKMVEFSLQPSSEFLKTVVDGKEVKRRALFIKREKPDFAHLRDVTKNEGDKDIVSFSIATQNDPSLKCLLLEAKNNRNAVRVFVSSTGGCFDADFSKAIDLQIR